MEQNQYSEKPQGSSLTIGIRNGLILAGLVFVIGFLSSLVGLQETSFGTYAALILIGAMTVWSMLQLRKKRGGYINFGPAFVVGFFVNLIYSLVIAGLTVLFIHVIDPTFTETFSDELLAQMEEQNPNMSDEELDLGVQIVQWLLQPLPIFFFTLVIFTFVGLIISLVSAAVIQRQNPDPFADVE